MLIIDFDLLYLFSPPEKTCINIRDIINKRNEFAFEGKAKETYYDELSSYDNSDYPTKPNPIITYQK